MLTVKNFVITKKDYAPLALLIVSVGLMIVSVVLQSMLVIAGLTGLVVGWFLCIDKLISAAKLSIAYRVVLACVAIGLPVAISVYMS